MLPWMIEMDKDKQESERVKQVPLYLPLEDPLLTGSAEHDKKERERGSSGIDYSL